MPGDIVPFPPTLSGNTGDVVPSPTDKLLIDMAGLAHLTSLSVRTLRRMDAARDIPGRVAVGRRVLFQTEIIRAWVRAGLPGRKEWETLTRRESKR
ncbi:MAG TPA: hypothetical protein VKD72_29000 [Gemmataceae bacterium]|nr:hypothetical protein [Gemmataceae bacterium]